MVSAIKRFQVIVTGVPTAHEDLEEDPRGCHKIEAEDQEEALNEFHATVPIACLDDFEIEVVEAPNG